jgi:hypothetical protein
MLSEKHKYEDENRGFKTEWEEEFVFVERNGITDHCQRNYFVLKTPVLLKVSCTSSASDVASRVVVTPGI